MPLVSLARVLLNVLMRAMLVFAVAIPALVFLIVAGAAGPGDPSAGLFLCLATGLGGMAWAFLPFIHFSRVSGLLFAGCWLSLALLHGLTSPKGVGGAAVASWLFATLFLAIRLKADPPGYFPRSWKDAAASCPTENDA